MFSIWEQQSFLKYDHLIVGAGITGLSAAACLKERHPELRVAVIERGILPTGASTKNAGFACFGSLSELLSDIQTLGEDEMLSLVEKRWKGLQRTRKRLGDSAIDLKVNGGYELLFEQGDALLQELDRINELLSPLFKSDVYQVANEKIKPFRFSKTRQLIENKLEGQLDTGKLMSSLWDYCSRLGVRIHTGCEVTSLHEDHGSVAMACKGITFQAGSVGVCSNAFTHHFLNTEETINPGRGIVMCIQPEQALPFEGTFHYEEGFYYFRNYYGKLLFGGGRNIAIKEEETTIFDINQKIKEKLIEDLENIILPDQRYHIELEWTGIMAFGEDKKPIVKKVTDNIIMGVRLGGMGVAIGSLVGEEVASFMLNR
ncbi:MAG: FAD-dependent oxidoreductase [Ekhidna sp.]